MIAWQVGDVIRHPNGWTYRIIEQVDGAIRIRRLGLGFDLPPRLVNPEWMRAWGYRVELGEALLDLEDGDAQLESG